MLKKFPLLLLLFALLPLIPVEPALAQEPGEINFDDYMLSLVDYTLPNGLRVVLAEDHSAPVVAVDIWYRVGGADDPPGRAFYHNR